jgi:hypothetical protein
MASDVPSPIHPVETQGDQPNAGIRPSRKLCSGRRSTAELLEGDGECCDIWRNRIGPRPTGPITGVDNGLQFNQVFIDVDDRDPQFVW